MNKKILLGTLAGGIVGFLLGWLIFGMLLMDYYKGNCTTYPGLMKDPPVVWCFGIGNLLWAWMLSYVYRTWANVTTFVRGATAAIIISFPVVATYDLSFYASMNLMTVRALAVDVVANVILYAIVGGVIGIVLGMGEKKA